VRLLVLLRLNGRFPFPALLHRANLPVNRIDDIAWRPGFNDSDPLGWVTFAAYGVAAVLCIRAARSGDGSPTATESKGGWFLFALALGFLGLNVQLDLHAFLFQWARQIAETQGWYEKRRTLQRAFIVIFSGALVVGIVFACLRFQGFVKTQKLAVLGALLIVAYVIIRNAAFNHIDDRKGSMWNMKESLRLLELTGATAIAVAARRYSRSRSGR
jgi:hypothetical protein